MEGKEDVIDRDGVLSQASQWPLRRRTYAFPREAQPD